MDALAKRATRFTNAFCTTPSCVASRANILTDHYSHTHSHSIHNFHTGNHTPSIVKALSGEGYAAGIIGKMHVQPEAAYPWTHNMVAVKGSSRSPQGMADRTHEFFTDIGDVIFYLHMGFSDPHRDFGNSQNYVDYTETKYGTEDVPVPNFLPDHLDVRAELAEYYQLITRMDAGFGRAVEVLEEAGRAEDTMIIVMSDHGTPFTGAKASSFNSGHNCPLLIARPGASEVESDALVNWNSIAPTVYDWCGVDSPDGLPEKSLLPILDDSHPEGWDEVIFSRTFH